MVTPPGDESHNTPLEVSYLDIATLSDGAVVNATDYYG
jgi:hypothetical protein